MVMFVTTHSDWVCDNVDTPGTFVEINQAQDSRSATILKLKTVAVTNAITAAILMSSFIADLSPHPDEVSVFS